jgi:hypothetical protein
MTAQKPATRIYAITGPGTTAPRLVEAASPAQALRHVARGTFRVAVAGSLEVARMMGHGVTVERATDDDAHAA